MSTLYTAQPFLWYNQQKDMVYFAKDIESSRDYFLGDPQLKEYVADILSHPKYIGVGRYIVHHYESRQKHLLNVAYYAHKIARLLGVDSKITIRAALLHDFYPYKRFKKDIGFHTHLRDHPSEAVRYANSLFELGPIEKKLILHHHWPFVPGLFYHWREGLAVSLADLFASSMENFYHGAHQKAKRGAVRVKEASKNGAKKVVSATARKVKTRRKKSKNVI